MEKLKAKKTRGKRPGLRARSKNARIKSRKYNVAERDELHRLRIQVRRARECMEVNDPLNARDIFGPPEFPSQSESADAEGGTPETAAPILEQTCQPPEGDDVYL